MQCPWQILRYLGVVRDYPSNAISADENTVLNNATCGNYRIVVNTERSVMREYSSYNL